MARRTAALHQHPLLAGSVLLADTTGWPLDVRTRSLRALPMTHGLAGRLVAPCACVKNSGRGAKTPEQSLRRNGG
jgi:hypothetical protein